MDSRVAQHIPRSHPPRARRDDAQGRAVGALDLGTNNCRLLVARPSSRGFEVVDSFSRTVRLGEGLAETGRIAPEAADRALLALGVCADKLRRHGVRRMRAVATEACRRAANRSEFLDRVRRETGLRLDIITAEEEARLAVAGCAPLHDAEAEHLLVIDIGGGSTELIWVDLAGTPPHLRGRLLMALAPPRRGALDADARARAAAAHIREWVSAPVGVATLSDRFAHLDEEAARFAAMTAASAEALAAFSAAAARLPAGASRQIIGASGTVTTLAGAHLGLRRYDRSRVDGMWLGVDDARAVIARIAGLDETGRAAFPGIGPDRAALLPAGSAILSAVLDLWPAERLRVADRGLREGLLYALIGDQPRAQR